LLIELTVNIVHQNQGILKEIFELHNPLPFPSSNAWCCCCIWICNQSVDAKSTFDCKIKIGFNNCI